MKKYPFTPEEFREIYSKVPRLSLDPVIRTDSGIILTKRQGAHGWAGQWHLPGGTMFVNETVEQGLRRIIDWEIGAQVEIIQQLPYLEYPSEAVERGYGKSVSLVFLCDLVPGSELRTDENASEVGQFTEIPENTIAELKKYLLNHWKMISAEKFW